MQLAVTGPGKQVHLRRVRPPTLAQLERCLDPNANQIVHFMGHSNSVDGRSVLLFENEKGRRQVVRPADLADGLDAHTLLVLLNSCRSAVAADWTAFGNIARGLVQAGIPYALGMQFELPDDAALALSRTLYDFLLQGRPLEEAVRRTRRALLNDTTLRRPEWLAGVPLLYTNQREPLPALTLPAGAARVDPDALALEAGFDLSALRRADHFVGRVIDGLLDPEADFVVIHGLGGVGKSALAVAVVQRESWRYQDRGLAISFEGFTRPDAGGTPQVNPGFGADFLVRLARFYGLDPESTPETGDLQRAILQRRTHQTSLLLLDNMETLIDAQLRGDATARALTGFISRLKEGRGDLLLTSRIMPPADWGSSRRVALTGLSDEAGAELFRAILPVSPQDRRRDAPAAARLRLSHRVQGHPLSIRLLAGRFAAMSGDLDSFLDHIEERLQEAEAHTPTSLDDPERQATLYACMDYSVARLNPSQRALLGAAALFQSPFESVAELGPSGVAGAAGSSLW